MGLSKFKNIRVKMKGGKSRIQRAMVLPSGKLRFVKNLSRSRSNAPRQKTKTKQHRSVIHTARKRRGHGGGRSMTAGIEKAAKGVALFGPAALQLMSGESGHQKAVNILRDYTGINADHGGKWEPHNLINGWGPFVGVTIASKVAHKIIGLVRRI